MEQNTLNRLKLELESFKGLVIANLLGAALTLAFSMAFGIGDVLPFIMGGPIYAHQLPYVALIVGGFAFTINWITRSAELMEEHEEITDDLNEVLENRRGDDEAITGIIVRSLAFYRDKAARINQLKWGGRITGTFLILSVIPQVQTLSVGDIPFGGWMIYGQWFGLIASLGFGLGAWYVPVIIDRFIKTWDTRLNLADEASEKLERILEETG